MSYFWQCDSKERNIMKLSRKGIIIDAEAFHKFININHEDSKPVHQCIKKGTLKLVYGNDKKSSDEIKRDSRMIDMLGKLTRAGAVYQANSKEKKKEIDAKDRIIEGTQLKSNDTHIIAIALVEKKARLLFSVSRGDKKLHKDFRNPKIIKEPRGNIYQEYSKHSGLLPR